MQDSDALSPRPAPRGSAVVPLTGAVFLLAGLITFVVGLSQMGTHINGGGVNGQLLESSMHVEAGITFILAVMCLVAGCVILLLDARLPPRHR